MKRTLGSTDVDEQHQQYRPTFIDRQITVSLLSSRRPPDIKDASTTPLPTGLPVRTKRRRGRNCAS